MTSRSSDIIILLGAGASVESGIPSSATMIEKIEELILDHENWSKFKRLYNHVKSAIHYSSGLHGSYGKQVPFNIETLVNTLYELERNEEHPLYPFIAAWNFRFVELAKPDFRNVSKFRSLILNELKQWMCPENTSDGNYYAGLKTLQQQLNYPLHVFTLNYDLCVERIGVQDFRVETGFAEYGPNHHWDWERFEQSDGGRSDLAQIYLYKLHGSINWKRDDRQNLFSVEQTENVDPEQMDVIFGRDFKIDAADPYLFYAYQFRRFTLDARLIVIVGYSFADEHINKMLTQALRSEDARKLLIVANCAEETLTDKKCTQIVKQLSLLPTQVEVHIGTAKSFFENENLGALLIDKIPQRGNAPF